jgi:glutathione reductase (NADPH)
MERELQIHIDDKSHKTKEERIRKKTQPLTLLPYTTRMANATATYDYDLLVLGGGSGGCSTAKRAAQHGARTAIVEGARWGGTCVNVGCVPKKIMFQAAGIYETVMHDTDHYELSIDKESVKFDWTSMKEKRDKYILRLNNIYRSGLVGAGVALLEGWASFVDAHTIIVKMNDGSTKTVTADKIIIATGGSPMVPPGEGIVEHCITSDGFFELTEQPEKVVVVGAGYVAVELAGVLNALGSDTHLVVRKQKALRDFDPAVSDFLDSEMVRQGMTIHRNTAGVAKVELVNGKKKVTTVSGEVLENVDVVLVAPGRVPGVSGLNLASTGVELRPNNTIVVNDYQQTTVDNIAALGDVAGQVELTPMAIAGTYAGFW